MLSWTDDFCRCSIEWRFLSRNKLSINVIKFLLKSRPIFLTIYCGQNWRLTRWKFFLTSQKIKQLLISKCSSKIYSSTVKFSPSHWIHTQCPPIKISNTYQYSQLNLWKTRIHSFLPQTYRHACKKLGGSRRDKGKKEYRAEECGGNNGDGKVIRWPLNAIKPAVAR